jgi:hypothetical protein
VGDEAGLEEEPEVELEQIDVPEKQALASAKAWLEKQKLVGFAMTASGHFGFATSSERYETSDPYVLEWLASDS